MGPDDRKAVTALLFWTGNRLPTLSTTATTTAPKRFGVAENFDCIIEALYLADAWQRKGVEGKVGAGIRQG